MISTVTTSTVTTITSVVSTAGMGASLALVAILAFLVLVIQREVVSVTAGKRSVLGRGLSIGLIPLGFAFLMIAGSRVIEALR